MACKVQLSSPTIYIEQVHLIPGKTAERTGCTQFMPRFYCPQHLGGKKKSADVTEDTQAPNPWEAVLAHPLGQHLQTGDRGDFSFMPQSH